METLLHYSSIFVGCSILYFYVWLFATSLNWVRSKLPPPTKRVTKWVHVLLIVTGVLGLIVEILANIYLHFA